MYSAQWHAQLLSDIRLTTDWDMVSGGMSFWRCTFPLPSREWLLFELKELRALEPLRRAEFNRAFYWNYGSKAPDQFIELLQQPWLGRQIIKYIDELTLLRLMLTCSALWHLLMPRRYGITFWFMYGCRHCIKSEIPIAKQRWQDFQNEIERVQYELSLVPEKTPKPNLNPKPKKPQLLGARDWKDKKRAWKQAQRK